MTFRTISGDNPTGVTIAASYAGAIIEPGASVEGNGVDMLGFGTLDNYGSVRAAAGDAGVYLSHGGLVTNGLAGYIGGTVGVKSLSGVPAGGTLVNNGLVVGSSYAVELLEGGSVVNANTIGTGVMHVAAIGVFSTNGSLNLANRGVIRASTGVDLTAGVVSNSGTISAYLGVLANQAATVTNYGMIVGFAGVGAAVSLKNGGLVTNESAGTLSAISNAVVVAGATVVDNGLIVGGYDGVGVALSGASELVNGGAGYGGALIKGGLDGVNASGTTTVINRGTIIATNGAGVGLGLGAGCAATNGGGLDDDAQIEGAAGAYLSAGSSLTNYGTIIGVGTGAVRYGVSMLGARLTNGAAFSTTALIEGYGGVDASGGATIANFGTIRSVGGGRFGVEMGGGGPLTNGSAGDQNAVIEGALGVGFGATGTLTNYGAVLASSGAAVRGAGGQVINGKGVDPKALIQGASGIVETASATVGNVGVIDGAGGYSVRLLAGGSVINGSTTNASALIEGLYGVNVYGAAVTVGNFGTVRAIGGGAGAIYSQDGGVVTNGGNGDPNALIEGVLGVELLGTSGAVNNFGTIVGAAGAGVAFAGIGEVKNLGTIDGGGGYGVTMAGGSVTNGRFTDRGALIEGYGGVSSSGGVGVLGNFGTVTATGAGSYAVNFASGGFISNGAAGDTTALLQGEVGGAILSGAYQSTNFGTILGGEGDGVTLDNGAMLTNGAANRTGALIQGYEGLAGNGTVTVVNYGSIAGTGADALVFGSATDTLVVEAGSAFIGAVKGDGGVLDLASGAGTVSTIGGFIVSGSMASTTFSAFNTLEIGAAAAFAFTGIFGNASLAAGQSLVDNGVVTVGGALNTAGVVSVAGSLTAASISNTGAIAVTGGLLTVTGAVSGAGSATINGGALYCAGAFTENVTFAGATGTLELGASQGYTGSISGFSKTSSTSLDLRDIGFVSSSEATYSGTSKGGVLTVTDGAHTARINFKGNYTGSTWVASSDGHGGVIVVDPKAPASPLAMIAAMASFGPAAPAPAASRGLPRTEPPLIITPRSSAA